LGAKYDNIDMARAKRHYIPGQIWHITHRCHKREFLLKFSKDQRRWLQWLFEAKRRYGLTILNYTVTSNHIHLLVADDKGRDVIPDSIKLIAGRTGQEFNQRKARKGAYWEDRYHATAVEDGDHLLQCVVYIDLNMVRAGVVEHPSEWPYSGYNEIQEPKRKNVLINYERLREFLGFDTYDRVKAAHRKWVESCLKIGDNYRQDKWTGSIAVGSERFIGEIKTKMGGMAAGRWRKQTGVSFELREAQGLYFDHSEAKKSEIDPINAYTWA
jgi:putative transposase